jgi:hypothetical protein
MDLHVFSQISLQTEAFTTSGALMNILSVNLLMFSQCTVGDETLATLYALVGFFSSMSLPVVEQVGSLMETLSTYITGKGSFSRMAA